MKDKEEFVKLFKIAEVSNLNPDEMAAYEASLKIARDNYSHDETVRKEAELKGRLEGRHDRDLEIAREMKKDDFSIEQIAKLTGLSKEEIESLDR
ncbi:hypothetical protein [Pedobacter sp. B4-66]|uniref:hypothetical protein n=1 Tax=Pedobacter sp. B4-66 TaxID=2817280 RepID=UPI00202439B4|nr:hypothetical protein [Pedobacter sp. B4-66]